MNEKMKTPNLTFDSADSIELKQKAEVTLQKAKEVILASIPHDEIISMYIKGSYAQGELLPNSDVDVVVILKNEEYVSAVYELTEQYGRTTNPPFQIVAYTLKELQTGERAKKRTKDITSVSRFVKHMDSLPLMYGEKPKGQLFTRTDEKDLSVNSNNFRTAFIPDYMKGTLGFDELVKQVFWLVEAEQRLKGIDVGYSWQKLADGISDPNHIVHLCLKFRRQRNVTNQDKKGFIKTLEKYMNDLSSK